MCDSTAIDPEAPQFNTRIRNIAIEMLSILYSRNLSHEELVSFRKQFVDNFQEYQQQIFRNFTNEYIQQVETKQRMAMHEAFEREKRMRQSAERVCTACKMPCNELFKVGENDFYCYSCRLQIMKNQPQMRPDMMK